MFRYVHKIDDPTVVLKSAPMGFVEIPPVSVPQGFVVAELNDGSEMPEYTFYELDPVVDTNALYDAFGEYFAKQPDALQRQLWVTIDELLTLTTLAGYRKPAITADALVDFLEPTLNKFDTAVTDDLFVILEHFAPS